MRFTELEFSAITKIVIAVINADGRVEENEVRCMAKEALRFGFKDNDIEKFITEANTMETSQAIAVINSFDDERKKYVCAYLGTIMAVDGNLNDKEVALWRLVSSMCRLPEMSIKESITYISSMQ